MKYPDDIAAKRLDVVVDAIGQAGWLEIRSAAGVLLGKVRLASPSFDVQERSMKLLGVPLRATASAVGRAVRGTITDANGAVVIDDLMVGVDIILDKAEIKVVYGVADEIVITGGTITHA